MEQGRLAREDTSGALLTAAAAGLAAAIAGAIAWGLIVRWTEYEIGFAAWGIGFLAGAAVVAGARGARGMPFQVLAVVLALLGVVLGKYLAMVWSFNAVAEEEGVPFRLDLFSGDSFDIFTDRESGVWSWFDALWVGLAVFTAFRMPRAEEHEPMLEEGAPETRAEDEPR